MNRTEALADSYYRRHPNKERIILLELIMAIQPTGFSLVKLL